MALRKKRQGIKVACIMSSGIQGGTEGGEANRGRSQLLAEREAARKMLLGRVCLSASVCMWPKHISVCACVCVCERVCRVAKK